jgi:hypothetical protein
MASVYIVSYFDTQQMVYTRIFKEYDAACTFIRPLMHDDDVLDIVFQKHIAVENSDEYALEENYDVVDVFSDILSDMEEDYVDHREDDDVSVIEDE